MPTVTVAIDPFDSTTHNREYFDADLRKEGLLPVQIIVSNQGTRRLMLRPANVVLLQDRSVIDPIPPERGSRCHS